MKLASFFTKQIPYLESAKDKLSLIGFGTLYSLVFITVYTPFNIDEWGENLYLHFVVIGACVLLFTQFVLRPLFKFQHLKLYELIIWGFMETLLIALALFLLLTPDLANFPNKWNEYYLNIKYTTLVLIVPYTLYVWYKELQYNLSSLRAKQLAGDTAVDRENKLLTIHRDNGQVALAIKYSQFLYVKSAGNYLDIFYLKDQKAVKELVRGSLKELEAKIEDSAIIRTHRSYLLNTKHIASVKKTKKGYDVTVQFIAQETVPVSPSHKAAFEATLTP